jgi:hypothetical protein
MANEQLFFLFPEMRMTGAFLALPSIGHWKLVIGHFIRRIHGFFPNYPR